MIRLKWSNNSMMLLSVMLAILLWVYVNNVQNPIKEQEFRVTLDTRGELPQGLSISGLPKTVTVKVQGKNAQLSGVRPADFQAIIDLSNLDEGKVTKPVQVTGPSNLQVIQINPARVEITAERTIQKQIPVTAIIKGEPVSGYTFLEPTVQPTAVLVRGPSRSIKELKQLQVTVDITGASQSVEQVVTIPVPSGLTAAPDKVTVIVPVNRALPFRVLPVVPRYTGIPAEQYLLERVTVQPSTVQVYGPLEILNNLDNIYTENVKIEGIKDDLVKDVKLVLPPGVEEIIPGKAQINIQVKSKETPTETPEPPDTTPEEPKPPGENQPKD